MATNRPSTASVPLVKNMRLTTHSVLEALKVEGHRSASNFILVSEGQMTADLRKSLRARGLSIQHRPATLNYRVGF